VGFPATSIPAPSGSPKADESEFEWTHPRPSHVFVIITSPLGQAGFFTVQFPNLVLRTVGVMHRVYRAFEAFYNPDWDLT
jgi:hypothetical protein